MLDLRSALARCPIVAILRGVRPDEVEAVADALIAAGVLIVEVPLNSPEPFTSIRKLSSRFGSRALIGAGTVLKPSEPARVAAAGGRLAVMPNFDAAVVHASKGSGLIALPGVMTPSEGFAALNAGADGLKLFPAEMIPPAIVKAWRAVFPPDCLLLAVGGVGEENIRAYREAGASGYGIGSSLYKPGRPAAEVGRLAQALVAALSL